MLKKYSLYILKSQKTLISIYSFICFIIFPLLVLVEDGIEFCENAMTGLYIYSTVLCIGVILVPLISYYFHYNKRSVDVYYSLPINKKDLFNIHYFIPLITLYTPIVINYIIGLIVIYIKDVNVTNPAMLINPIIMLICVFSIMSAAYAMITFFIHKCNSFIDAIIIGLSSTLLPYLVYGGLYSIIEKTLIPTGIYLGHSLSIMLKALSPFYNTFNLINDFNDNIFPTNHIYVIAYMFVLGIVMYILAKKAFMNKKGEDATQITNHILTYPLIINISSLCIISLINFFDISSMSGFVISLCFVFIIFIVMHSIAKRKVLLTAKIVFKFIFFIGIVIAISFVSTFTNCFNLNNQLVNIDFDEVVVYIYYDDFENTENEYGIKTEYDYIVTDKETINKIQNLQLKASEQYSQGTYGEINKRGINLSILYNGKYESENRYYTFEESDIADLLEDLVRLDQTQSPD